MSDTLALRDSPTSSPVVQARALRREWKRYKPHLPKSTSLPSLQLLPPDRPLFTCRQCKFTNSQIPLCLWCSWTNDEATREFEKSANSCAKRRGRRVSSPVRHGDGHMTRKEANDNYRVSVVSNLPPVALLDDGIIPAIERAPFIATVLPGDTSPPQLGGSPPKKSKRSSKRYGMISGTHDIRTNARPSSVQTQHRPPYRESRDKIRPARPRSRLPDSLASESTKGVIISTASSHADTSATVLTPPPSLCPVASSSLNDHLQPRTMKADSTSGVPSTLLHSSSSLSLSLSQPQRTIRRKKRMTLLKQKSSRSLRTSASAPLLNVHTNHDSVTGDDGIPSPTPPASTRIPTPAPSPIPISAPQAPTTVRLGHPSRPYYTAIRPNMSRPSSPFDTSPRASPSISRAPSPSFSLPHSIPCTSAHQSDTPFPPTLAQLSSRSSYPSSHPNGNATIGFSLSGETELRMALARWRSADGDMDALGDGEPSEYRFREMGIATGNLNMRSKEGSGKRARFGGKMKRLGMGILELVIGRK